VFVYFLWQTEKRRQKYFLESGKRIPLQDRSEAIIWDQQTQILNQHRQFISLSQYTLYDYTLHSLETNEKLE